MTSEYWLESMLAVVTRPGQGKNECGTRIARGLARHGAPADINDLAKELLQARLDQPRVAVTTPGGYPANSLLLTASDMAVRLLWTGCFRVMSDSRMCTVVV